MARELELIYGDALAEIGACGPDRTVSAEDSEEMGRVYDSLWHLLDEMGLASWGVDDDIPNGAVIPVVWLLAYHAAGTFGVKGERLNRLAINGILGNSPPSLGEKLLRKLATPKYLAETTQTVDY